MKTVPKDIVFARPNDFVSALASYLNKCGYKTRVDYLRGNETARLARTNPSERLTFVWAGPHRKASNDHHPTSPSMAYMENGFLPHYTSLNIDCKGHCAKSSIPEAHFDNINEEQKKELDEFLARYYFCQTEPIAHIPLPPPPYILFPIQHTRDSVMRFDAPNWAQDFTTLVGQIANVIPKDHTLIVKQHPKQRMGLSLFNGMPRVAYIDPRITDEQNKQLNFYLMKNSTALIAVNSSFILEALAHKIPSISLGMGIFTGHNVVKEVYGGIPQNLFEDISYNEEAVYKFLYEICLNRQITDINDIHSIRRVWDKFCLEYSKLWS